MYGIWVFIIAKIIGTAFLARIFSLTKPALMTIGWFNRTYTAIDGWKQRLYAYVRAMPTYQRIKAWAKEIRLAVKYWWQARHER